MQKNQALSLVITLSVIWVTGCGACFHISDSRSIEPTGDNQVTITDPTATRLIPELQQYLLANAELVKPTSEFMDKDDIGRDVVFLERSLRGSYGGYERAASNGFNWAKTFASLRSLEPMAIDLWQSRLVDAFANLKDGHFAITRVDTQGNHTNWQSVNPKSFKRYEGTVNCVAASGLSPYFENGVLTKKFVSFSSTQPSGENCKWNIVPPTWIQRPSEPTAHPLNDSVYLVHVHDFQSLRLDKAVWNAFRASLASLRMAKIVVIDLRGNSGGDDHEFYLWLNELYGRRLPTAVYHRLSSAWTHLSLVNSFGENLARNDGDKVWQEQMKKWRNSSLEYLSNMTVDSLNHRDWDTWDRATIVQEPSSKQTFAGQVIVLVDRFCASACELAVKTLRSIEGTKIAGENTAGVAAIGNNIYQRLPGSNLKILWGNWRERDLSGSGHSFQEGRGYEPDIWLAPGSAESDEDIHRLVAAIQGSL